MILSKFALNKELQFTYFCSHKSFFNKEKFWMFFEI